jgi:hypothetical protein
MCTGACILYKVKRVVIGENVSFMGGEELLKNRGKEVVVLDNAECKELMANFMKEKPELWYVSVSSFVCGGGARGCIGVPLVVVMLFDTDYGLRIGMRISLSSLFRLAYITLNTLKIEHAYREMGCFCLLCSLWSQSGKKPTTFKLSVYLYGQPMDLLKEELEVLRVDKWCNTCRIN